jgi:hypothetical protein
MIFWCDVYYYSDDVNVLYPVAVKNLMVSRGDSARPLEYLIVLAANNLYLPLWLIASLLCVVGTAIVSGLACERLFERQLPKAGWRILGLANPLAFYIVSQPDEVATALSDLVFAVAIFTFISEFYRLRAQSTASWRDDITGFSLNLVSAALIFTKETAVAAAVVMPAVTAFIRFRVNRLSHIFLLSLLFPAGATGVWILLKLGNPILFPTAPGTGRYYLKLDPITWAQNFVVTFAFPITPLPTSFMEFELLRPLWVAAAVGSFILFVLFLLWQALRRPRIILPLLVVVVSSAPMILVHSSEKYSTMFTPLMISTILIFTVTKAKRFALTYGLLLYIAAFANGVIYCLGVDFNLLGLERLDYSIYGTGYQFYPICPIRTTARVGFDPTANGELPFGPPLVKGRITCIQ